MAAKPKRKMIDILAVARLGGEAYVRNHTPEQRSKQARKAVRARWKRYREQQKLAAAEAAAAAKAS